MIIIIFFNVKMRHLISLKKHKGRMASPLLMGHVVESHMINIFIPQIGVLSILGNKKKLTKNSYCNDITSR